MAPPVLLLALFTQLDVESLALLPRVARNGFLGARTLTSTFADLGATETNCEEFIGGGLFEQVLQAVDNAHHQESAHHVRDLHHSARCNHREPHLCST